MKIISHRGNRNGPDDKWENHPSHIHQALLQGFDVEVDIWYLSGQFYLGHDKPLYTVEEGFLEDRKLWCHAKNPEALVHMLLNDRIHCFWHEHDAYTLTSKGIIWSYVGAPILPNSIVVLPEQNSGSVAGAHGICTDFPNQYR